MATFVAIDLVAFSLWHSLQSAEMWRLDAFQTKSATELAPAGTRVAGSPGNLFMALGWATVPGYRTLSPPLPGYVLPVMERDKGTDPVAIEFLAIEAGGTLFHPAYNDPRPESLPRVRGEIAVAVYAMIDPIPPYELRGGPCFLFGRRAEANPPGAVFLSDRDPSRPGIARIADAVRRRSQVVRESNVAYRVAAPGPGRLVVSQWAGEGWTARIAREGASPISVPVERFDGYWASVEIAERGEYVITFTYDPPGARLGAWLSAAGGALWLALLVAAVRARR